MAGEMERDARLILRAENRASRTFDEVAASVKKVRQEIAEQNEAMRDGKGDLNAYNRALDELKSAGDDLVKGQSLIRQFESQGEAIDKAKQRLEAATAALATYQAKAGANPTDTQGAQLEKKAAAIARAQTNLDRAETKLDGIVERMGRAGIATDNLETQFNQMGSAAVEAAQGIAAAKNAIDDYPAAVKRATAAADEFKAAQDFAGKDTSFLSPSEFGFIQSLDGAKAKLAELAQFEALEARSAAAAGQAERQRRAQQLEGIQAVLRGNDALDAQFKELAASEQRLKDLDAFRKIGTDAAESAVRVERYGASVQSLGNDFQSFAGVVRQALGGTSSGLQDIGQAITQIDASVETLDGGKKKLNDLQASAGRLSIAIATLDRTARQIDGFRAQQAAVQNLEATFAEAQAEVLRLARAVGEADAPVEALEADLVRAQRALDKAGREMQNARNDAVRMGDALRKAGVDTNNLKAEMDKIGGAAGRAGKTFDGLSGKLRGKGGFLGLNAFEMQNLGYQVNDVFTQLGSGTPILQILAQQGGQVIQLFQGLGSALLKASPLIAGVLLLLSPFIGALVQAARATDALRTAQTLLAGTGSGVTPEMVTQYQNAAVQIQNLGNTAKEATDLLTTFRDSGLDPSGLSAFVNAIDLAVKGGADMADSTKLLSEALVGGQAEVQALNDKFQILTPTEEEQIVAMIESGNESEARRIIYEKFEATAQRMADSARGDWSKGWADLKIAFNNFTNAISDSRPFEFLRESFRLLIYDAQAAKKELADIVYFMNYVSKRGVGGTVKDLFTGPTGSKEQKEAATFANNGGRPPKAPAAPRVQRRTLEGTRAIREQQEAVDAATESTKKLTRAETEQSAKRKAYRSAVGSPGEKAAQAELAAKAALIKFDDDASKQAEREAKKGAAAGRRRESAARSAAKAAETLANQRRTIEETLVRDLDTLEAKVDKGTTQSLDDRLSAIDKGYTGIFQKIEEFKRKGGTDIDGQTPAQYEAAVRAQIQMLRNAETLKFYEEGVNAAIKARGEQITAVNDKLDRGDIKPADATREVEEIVSKFAPQITKLSDDALAFAKSLRGAVPDPKMEAFISKFERVTQQNSAGQDRNLAKNFAQSVITDEQAKLDAIVRERDALVAAENALVEAGLRTSQDAQSSIAAAYARTTPLIQEQGLVLQGLLDSFVAAYPEMALFYDTWAAKLKLVTTAAQPLSANLTQIKSGLINIIHTNVIAGIDAIGAAIANFATGGQDAVDTLAAIGEAFLQFVLQTILAIAKLVLQAILLAAIDKATGGYIGILLKTLKGTGLHTGGVVGQEQTFGRRVPEAAFWGAPRYHGGGVAGFAPDEVPAILQRNEEVLTESDPRHRFNLGKGGSDEAAPASPMNVKIVNAFDVEDVVSAGVESRGGTKSLINVVRANKDAFNEALK